MTSISISSAIPPQVGSSSPLPGPSNRQSASYSPASNCCTEMLRIQTSKENSLKTLYGRTSAVAGSLISVKLIALIFLGATAWNPVGWICLGIGLALALISLAILVYRHRYMSENNIETDTGKTFIGGAFMATLPIIGPILSLICNTETRRSCFIGCTEGAYDDYDDILKRQRESQKPIV